MGQEKSVSNGASIHAGPRRILVTGGAGFIGSHLCERLLASGHEVFCLDNFFTGHRSNIARLPRNNRFQLLQQDIADPVDLAVDEIYNLACPASPVHYQRYPTETVKTSVIGAINMLDLALASRAKILQASTSEVYGDPQVHPQKEDYWGHVNPIGPRACYDEGKRCAETLFFAHHLQHQLPIKVVRIFNTYGPRMRPDDGRVVSNFIIQALTGQPITVFGDGSQTRSFCFVDDLVDGLLATMNNTADSFTGPINLGNPSELNIRGLAELIVEMTGSKSKVTLKPLPKDDPKQRCPDISLAKSQLGWEPSIRLQDGLMKTIDYFENMLLAKDRLDSTVQWPSPPLAANNL